MPGFNPYTQPGGAYNAPLQRPMIGPQAFQHPIGGMPGGMTGGMGGMGGGGGNWLTGAASKVSGWLGKGDNAMDLAELALGAGGAYMEGRTRDKQIAEERRRYEDEKRRKEEATGHLTPLIESLMTRSLAGRG